MNTAFHTYLLPGVLLTPQAIIPCTLAELLVKYGGYYLLVLRVKTEKI